MSFMSVRAEQFCRLRCRDLLHKCKICCHGTKEVVYRIGKCYNKYIMGIRLFGSRIMKLFKSLFIALTIALFLTPVVSSASPSESENGLIYTLNDNGEATVIGYSVSTTSLHIPSEIDGYPVIYISERAFYSNQYITSVTIDEGVKQIGAGAFSYCPNLLRISLPSSITEIPENAFEGCAALRSAVLTDGIESIGSGAFSGCITLRSIKVPASISYIGTEAFQGCEKLILDCSDNGYAKQYARDNHIPTSFFGSWSFTALLLAAASVIPSVIIIIIVKKRKSKAEHI